MGMAFIGLLFAVLNRAVSPNARFVVEPSITKPILALAGVVVVTGLMTGGFGIRMLGSGRYGGRSYFGFLAAIVGYFVLTSRRIQPHRAGFYLAMFFLSGLTFVVSDLAALAGPKFDFLALVLPPASASQETAGQELLTAQIEVHRLGCFGIVGAGLYSYLAARFGLRGLLDLSQPWRISLFALGLAMGLLSGFRAFIIFAGLTLVLMFYLEGLHRTRYAPAVLGVIILCGIIVLPQAEKLPLAAQRALSFLPGKFDYVARQSAGDSLYWRIQMWKEALPDVPKHLFHGKGWGIDARQMSMMENLGDPMNPFTNVLMVGNYHNGPLSVLIPFGIYGAVTFVWFLIAAVRVLHRNWKYGDPALQNVNALLLAAFAARAVFFLCFAGALASDMAFFAGTLGMGVALNGPSAAAAQKEQTAAGVELGTEYIRV
jgi:hypothetical protein